MHTNKKIIEKLCSYEHLYYVNLKLLKSRQNLENIV